METGEGCAKENTISTDGSAVLCNTSLHSQLHFHSLNPHNMTLPIQSEYITAFLCGLLVFNILLLIATFATIPAILDSPLLGPLYALCLQLVVAIFAVRLFYQATNQMFELRNKKTIVLILVYGVFPLPIMVIKVTGGLLSMVCGCRC